MMRHPANASARPVAPVRSNSRGIAGRLALAVGVAAGALVLNFAVRADGPASAMSDLRDRFQANDTMNGLVNAITKPSKDVSLHFEAPGIVAQVFVEEGQVVKKDEKLAQQDDRQEQAELRLLQRDADSTADVAGAKAIVDSASAAEEAAELAVKTKEVEVKRLRNIAQRGGGNGLELEKAELEWHTAEKEVLKAQADVRKAQADVLRVERDLEDKKDKADKQRFHVENMIIRSPLDGIVQTIGTHAGEMAVADPSKASYTVVSNNPLHVDLNLTIPQAQALKDHTSLPVSHDGGKTWEMAEILTHNPVANASAAMQQLTLKLDNPQGRSSGMQVVVRLPKEVANPPREASAR